MSRFDPRKVPIFRAYHSEIPEELLQENAIDPDWVRVAKLDGAVIGLYALHPVTPLEFRIDALSVEPRFRRQGLASWLLRHAIGVCETKGARMITTRCDPATSLFALAGFRPQGDLLRLTLTPE